MSLVFYFFLPHYQNKIFKRSYYCEINGLHYRFLSNANEFKTMTLLKNLLPREMTSISFTLFSDNNNSIRDNHLRREMMVNIVVQKFMLSLTKSNWAKWLLCLIAWNAIKHKKLNGGIKIMKLLPALIKK
jgi:hypothetical protein